MCVSVNMFVVVVVVVNAAAEEGEEALIVEKFASELQTRAGCNCFGTSSCGCRQIPMNAY